MDDSHPMFPIRDHNPSTRTPYVTYTIMAINIVVFLLYWPFLNDGPRIWSFYVQWAMIPDLIIHGEQTHTFITHMFLHGGFMHLAGNMLFLWIFGDNLEDELGHSGFAIFYISAGLVAAIAQILSDPSSQIPMVGASGAIAGVMGGYLLLYPKARIDVLFIFIIFFKIFPIPAWIALSAWFAMQIFGGFGTDSTGGGTAYWAHAGGFVAGLVVLFPAFLRRGGVSFWRETNGHAQNPEATYTLTRSGIPVVRRRK